ncbi:MULTISPECIES: DUF72 domain-containing protein [Streptomycetaceae]|uniref:DUF72 domain-containing protein n=1 Tax=Streptantibioticus cattleyicolor (strain ATCC 35852 / DSM 46488 / JCM 4925 / NBRC 14057 / NRRL 8057) TaxID=1003195 RepID=F8JYA1_STREN|nr:MULTISPECIES: DUF72 domain-containing protein [Streptomycetaceae]AEW94693.1 protein of unknown function DUF72 [Streptantibioticus cattleyicolor NRRL 8057 = DSM 46488]MYS59325.1 DUF72 domain-containing protein [Streptomyces sp. SID5468]CCB75047.1 conserved protein of unknown function [Streptantibioticus cattleyicolor NRRL 8057 = DSM 46488]
MDDILVGTCSWTDPALTASGWYPPSARDPESRLRHYAARFPVVEVDATYYALPSVRNSRLWVARTPAGFVFDVKAFSLLTGHPTRVAALPPALRPPGAAPDRRLRPQEVPAAVTGELWQRYLGALEPLREAGRLGALLLQFPPWLAPGPRAEAFLARCRQRTEGWPVAVEFRHRDWWAPQHRENTAELLAGAGMTAVAVDTVQGLPDSLPPAAVVTRPELAVVRFHGRSPAWAHGGKEDRFRHEYTRAELASWLPAVHRLADRADQVHVLFNNCCGDAAVRSAALMEALLAGRVAPPSGAAVEAATRR